MKMLSMNSHFVCPVYNFKYSTNFNDSVFLNDGVFLSVLIANFKPTEIVTSYIATRKQ